MGQIAEKTNMAVKRQPQTINDWIKAYQDQIAKALPKVITPERFTRMVTTAVTQTPKLAQCTPQSFVGAMLTAAQLGLEPNTPLGQAYLIPYGNQCQFQIGYKGLIDLAHRSGELKNIEAHIVYENDDFDFEYGLEADLKHKPAMSERGNPVWVYAIYRLKSGGYGFEVMSWDECLAHGKKYSKTFKNGPWRTNPEEMAKKTMLKKVLKYAPMKSDFVTEDERAYTVEDDGGEIKVLPEDVIETEASEVDVAVDTETGEILQK
jgi:recombination protein RecT